MAKNNAKDPPPPLLPTIAFSKDFLQALHLTQEAAYALKPVFAARCEKTTTTNRLIERAVVVTQEGRVVLFDLGEQNRITQLMSIGPDIFPENKRFIVEVDRKPDKAGKQGVRLLFEPMTPSGSDDEAEKERQKEESRSRRGWDDDDDAASKKEQARIAKEKALAQKRAAEMEQDMCLWFHCGRAPVATQFVTILRHFGMQQRKPGIPPEKQRFFVDIEDEPVVQRQLDTRPIVDVVRNTFHKKETKKKPIPLAVVANKQLTNLNKSGEKVVVPEPVIAPRRGGKQKDPSAVDEYAKGVLPHHIEAQLAKEGRVKTQDELDDEALASYLQEYNFQDITRYPVLPKHMSALQQLRAKKGLVKSSTPAPASPTSGSFESTNAAASPSGKAAKVGPKGEVFLDQHGAVLEPRRGKPRPEVTLEEMEFSSDNEEAHGAAEDEDDSDAVVRENAKEEAKKMARDAIRQQRRAARLQRHQQAREEAASLKEEIKARAAAQRQNLDDLIQHRHHHYDVAEDEWKTSDPPEALLLLPINVKTIGANTEKKGFNVMKVVRKVLAVEASRPEGQSVDELAALIPPRERLYQITLREEDHQGFAKSNNKVDKCGIFFRRGVHVYSHLTDLQIQDQFMEASRRAYTIGKLRLRQRERAAEDGTERNDLGGEDSFRDRPGMSFSSSFGQMMDLGEESEIKLFDDDDAEELRKHPGYIEQLDCMYVSQQIPPAMTHRSACMSMFVSKSGAVHFAPYYPPERLQKEQLVEDDDVDIVNGRRLKGAKLDARRKDRRQFLALLKKRALEQSKAMGFDLKHVLRVDVQQSTSFVNSIPAYWLVLWIDLHPNSTSLEPISMSKDKHRRGGRNGRRGRQNDDEEDDEEEEEEEEADDDESSSRRRRNKKNKKKSKKNRRRRQGSDDDDEEDEDASEEDGSEEEHSTDGEGDDGDEDYRRHGDDDDNDSNGGTGLSGSANKWKRIRSLKANDATYLLTNARVIEIDVGPLSAAQMSPEDSIACVPSYFLQFMEALQPQAVISSRGPKEHHTSRGGGGGDALSESSFFAANGPSTTSAILDRFRAHKPVVADEEESSLPRGAQLAHNLLLRASYRAAGKYLPATPPSNHAASPGKGPLLTNTRAPPNTSSSPTASLGQCPSQDISRTPSVMAMEAQQQQQQQQSSSPQFHRSPSSAWGANAAASPLASRGGGGGRRAPTRQQLDALAQLIGHISSRQLTSHGVQHEERRLAPFTFRQLVRY